MRTQKPVTEIPTRGELYERLEEVHWDSGDGDRDIGLQRENAELLSSLNRQVLDALETIKHKLDMLEQAK